MADSIGDLKISVILDVATAEKNAQKVSTSLRSVETEARKTTDAVKNVSKGLSDVDKTTQKVSASTGNLKGNITGLGYGFVDLSRNLSMSTSIMGDLVGTMGAAIGTGSVLAGSIIALGSALAGLEKYTGFQINPTGGVQTGLIQFAIDAKVKDIVDAAYLKSIESGTIMTYADKVIAEKLAREQLIAENTPMGPGNKYGKITYEANQVPESRTSSTKSGSKTLPYVPDKVELTEQEKYIENLKKMNEALKFAKAISQTPRDFVGVKLPKYNLSDLSDKVQKVQADEEYTKGVNFKDAMSEGLNLATQISSVLGLGADNFINKFLSGIQTGISLISSFASLLSILSGGVGGGFLSSLGFASGGSVPGAGTGDSVPAMLTPGEFVINKRSASLLGSGFLQWLNGGGAVNSQITPAMMGGGNLTIIANGQLTDALSFQVVDKGMKLRNMKIERSSY